MQEFVTVPVAEELTGIPGRTIRNWIKGGKLSARKGDRGYIVRVQEVRDVARVAGRGVVTGTATGAQVGGKAGAVAIPEQDIQRAAAMIQEAMRPLVEEIGDLREELGRERARREEVERLLASYEAAGDGEGEERVPWWRRIFGG